ncbi:unnamed protein product [Ixodes hexagonus]
MSVTAHWTVHGQQEGLSRCKAVLDMASFGQTHSAENIAVKLDCNGKLAAASGFETRLCGRRQCSECCQSIKRHVHEAHPMHGTLSQPCCKRRPTEGWASCGRNVKDCSGHLWTLSPLGDENVKTDRGAAPGKPAPTPAAPRRANSVE